MNKDYHQQVENKEIARRHLIKREAYWTEELEKNNLHAPMRLEYIHRAQQSLIMSNKIGEFTLKLYLSIGL